MISGAVVTDLHLPHTLGQALCVGMTFIPGHSLPGEGFFIPFSGQGN